MNSFELIPSNPTKTLNKPIFICGQCERFSHSKELSESCCLCYYCKLPLIENGTNAYHSHHWGCYQENRSKQEKELLDKSEKLDSWDGPVYYEGFGFEYFNDLDSFIENWHYEYENENGELDEPLPEYVFICDVKGIDVPDVSDIIERICEEGYDGMYDDINGRDELQKALDKFKEDNKGIKLYLDNTKKSVKTKS